MSKFRYPFPEVRIIDDVLPHIEGQDEFIVVDKGDYKVINYVVAGTETFPPVDDLDHAIRRECRGLIFDSCGYVLSRPFHKFFNVNEREETLVENIDFDQPHVVLEKLDGSFIRPLVFGGATGKIIWGSKMGETDLSPMVMEWVNDGHQQYNHFARHMTCMKYTPIFEWCSRKQRIVIDYPEDRLVLLAIRDNSHGYYLPYQKIKQIAQDWKLDYVKPIFDSKVGNIEEFIQKVRDYEDGEGVVITFEDGHRLKVKGDYYVKIHRAKDALSSERKIVDVIMNNGLDDLKAVLMPADRVQIEEYETKFLKNLHDVKLAMDFGVEAAKRYVEIHGRKKFALEMAPGMLPKIRAIMFRGLDGADPVEEVTKTFIKNLNSNASFQELKQNFFPNLSYASISNS